MANRIFSAVVIVLAHLVAAVGAMVQQSDSAEAVQAITQIEETHARASREADLPTLERIWAPEYQFTAPNGMLLTRDAYLALLQRKAVAYDRLEVSALKVRVFGDAATVTGRMDVHGRAIDHIVDGVDDFLTVYVKRDGRWQQVASHVLRVPGTTRSEGRAGAGGGN